MQLKGNYRRIFLDMHIDDWNEVFLSKLDPKEIVDEVEKAGAQLLVIKCRPHTGLAYYPTKIGRMHKGLKNRDYVGEMISLCRERGIAVEGYFSQIFDNLAYEMHPEWRMVESDGASSRELNLRYGHVCLNNMEYREYVKACLTEITTNYQFDSFFLDMPYWPAICYCPNCRRRYYEETGHEFPRKMDWSDPHFLEWQKLREEWLGEFAQFSTDCIKSIRPEVMIEHNLSILSSAWYYAQTDLVAEASDYAGGDLYGGFLQQSFMCKYYRNVSRTLPFSYISSRCDPGLNYHTTTKTQDELLLHAVIALIHDGAFSICDGMNPDGTIVKSVYEETIRNVFLSSKIYEKYVGGKLRTDVSIWYPTYSNGQWNENGSSMLTDKWNTDFLDKYLNMARILRESHILFDVVPNKKLSELQDQVLVISDVPIIRDRDMEQIENFVKKGGHLYISGHLAHPKLLELLEAQSEGVTEHEVTYMTPTDAGIPYFSSFSRQAPLNIQGKMEKLKLNGSCEVLATMTLPYTMTGTELFASIHSNPPGIETDYPAVIRKKVGEGMILWTAAPIENSRPYMSKRTVSALIKSLIKKEILYSNAPNFVEIVEWEKENDIYLALVNEQENPPVAPLYHLEVTLPYKIKEALLLPDNERIQIEYKGNESKIFLPRLDIIQVIKIITC